MEDIPPSYYQSTNPSVLDLIAPYLDTPSLHALVLVSRYYNETFMPHLWGSPASHFVPMTAPTSPGSSRVSRAGMSYDDTVYVALTRFKRILKVARESTRRLVHTLYLPAAASEIYSGPNASWLREILDGLPNLQSLCVSGLPFFDHHSLVAVDRQRSLQPHQARPTYPVKLLLAAKEPNTTSIGLSLFLPYLSNLVYLDLSHTTPARDLNVLSSFSALTDLRILKLRGIGLRDMEAQVLANAIGIRVRLLDLAENLLGDIALRTLSQSCFIHPNESIGNSHQMYSHSSPTTAYSRRHLESWPVGLPPAPDFLSLDTLRSADFDKNLLVQLTHPLTGRLAFEDIPDSGITHLYINGNPAVTIDGVKGLLQVGRLHVLDAGDITGETALDKYVRSVRNSGKRHDRAISFGSGGASVPASRLSGGQEDYENEEPVLFDDDLQLPGAEKLIPVLRGKASKNLTYLRIEHALITKEITTTKPPDKDLELTPELPNSNPVELNGTLGETALIEAPGSHTRAVEVAGSNYHAVELPSQHDVFELDATPVIRAELPGDLIHFAISPPVGDAPESQSPSPAVMNPIRGEGPFAPEVVETNQDENNDKEVVLDATSSGVKQVTSLLPGQHVPMKSNGDVDITIDTVLQPKKNAVSSRHEPSLLDCQTKIKDLIKSRPGDESPKLHPSSLSNLRTLILTNVPDKVLGPNSPILKSIKQFIAACATESFIAILRAQTNYSLPPGRARAAAERKHAQSLFALRTIVLEVSPVQDNRQREWKSTQQRLSITKSSTGDRDSEALWSAAENDFSFFGEAGEEHDECGIYEHEPGKYFPSIHLDDKFSIMSDGAGSPNPGYNDTGTFNRNSPTGTVFRSPRELPLGRNRRSSNETRNSIPSSFQDRSSLNEMLASIPTSQPRPPPPTSAPKKSEPLQLVDLVSELSKWRKERKIAYEEEIRNRKHSIGGNMHTRIADSEVYVDGHWKGEIKVIRNSKPTGSVLHRGQGRLERMGMVDVYGNYFEKGYLYS